GFLLVYSIAERSSFDQIRPTYDCIKNVKGGQPFYAIVVANKCDLQENRQVSEEEGKLLAQEFGCQYIELSAKDAIGVDRAFMALVQTMKQH
ncbi:small monomeric GTPase, partial [Irpex rosettiformis]